MRPVRPGETPVFGSVWQWGDFGTPLLALRLVPKSTARGDLLRFVGVYLAKPLEINDGLIWSGPAHVGMGPVLTGWFCLEEGPSATLIYGASEPLTTISWDASGIFKVDE